MHITLWHRTSPESAQAIIADGFRDGHGTYLTGIMLHGVWLSDVPIDCNEGAQGDVLLAVILACSERYIRRWEVVEDGKPYREWIVPARTLNRLARIVEMGEEHARIADILPAR